MKWRILLQLPSYPIEKQSMIIVACMALHNFIRDNAINDEHFETYVEDSSGVGSQVPTTDGTVSADDIDMSAFCDAIASALVG